MFCFLNFCSLTLVLHLLQKPLANGLIVKMMKLPHSLSSTVVCCVKGMACSIIKSVFTPITFSWSKNLNKKLECSCPQRGFISSQPLPDKRHGGYKGLFWKFGILPIFVVMYLSFLPPVATLIWPDWSTLWIAPQPKWDLQGSNIILVHPSGFFCLIDVLLDWLSAQFKYPRSDPHEPCGWHIGRCRI